MKLLRLICIGSFLISVLLFIDDIAGVDTENGEGLVTANSGMITGRYSWPLLIFFGATFLTTSLILIIKSGRKQF